LSERGLPADEAVGLRAITIGQARRLQRILGEELLMVYEDEHTHCGLLHVDDDDTGFSVSIRAIEQNQISFI
jgi:hypothetical protein